MSITGSHINFLCASHSAHQINQIMTEPRLLKQFRYNHPHTNPYENHNCIIKVITLGSLIGVNPLELSVEFWSERDNVNVVRPQQVDL